MRHSDLILGLSSEERESTLHQVHLWDQMTVGAGLLRALLRHLPTLRRHLEGGSWPKGTASAYYKASGEQQRQLQNALEKLQTRLQNAPKKATAWTDEFTHPLDPQAMKLCRLLAHYKMRINAAPDIGMLHVSGREIEQRAIHEVRHAQPQHDARGGKPPWTTHDLVRHSLCRLFKVLEDWLPKASPEERQRVAEQIAKALDGLDAGVQEELRRAAKLDDLTAATFSRVGSCTALATGLATVAGVGGFGVYAMLSATIASTAAIIGLTLPFSVYIMATSLLAFLANPLVLAALVVGCGARWIESANRSMRAELAPLLVTFAVLKSADPEARRRARALAQHLADRHQEFRDGDRERRALLRQAFPAFPTSLGERACKLFIRAPLIPGTSAVSPFNKR